VIKSFHPLIIKSGYTKCNIVYFIIFRFPLHNVALLYAWLKAMDYDNSFDITENTLICSAHFKNDDFILENGSYDISPTAIPSKFKYEIVFR
jgi:hypothetical protein